VKPYLSTFRCRSLEGNIISFRSDFVSPFILCVSPSSASILYLRCLLFYVNSSQLPIHMPVGFPYFFPSIFFPKAAKHLNYWNLSNHVQQMSVSASNVVHETHTLSFYFPKIWSFITLSFQLIFNIYLQHYRSNAPIRLLGVFSESRAFPNVFQH